MRGGDTFRTSTRGGVGEGQEPRDREEGTSTIVSLGTGNWQALHPEPRLPPARLGISSHRPQRWPAGPEPGGGGSSLSTPPRLAPYRALGTSTGPRPPPGPARASPPYFSSMPAQEPPLPAPRALLMSRRRDVSAGAGASLPHASGAPRPRKPSRPRRSPGARQAGTRALGGTRPRAVPVAPVSGGRTGRDVAGPRHPAQQPSLPRE